ncbi:hypothetical protein V1477_002859 [Vespula maculifrons]|uniref:Uncharacterized protein n=1 Tax=Vespula maculifrons TaxID=7453 RepID=A0ABD2CXP4_VESMC
MKMSPWPTTPS